MYCACTNFSSRPFNPQPSDGQCFEEGVEVVVFNLPRALAKYNNTTGKGDRINTDLQWHNKKQNSRACCAYNKTDRQIDRKSKHAIDRLIGTAKGTMPVISPCHVYILMFDRSLLYLCACTCDCVRKCFVYIPPPLVYGSACEGGSTCKM